ncbi:NrdH-redoxin [Pseudactinotalea sp. HY158]|uniref:NrdH-redoxin n=1 Tax=Pseudactinotalea sp. HY158 TaxID=2654547 RepID=UPI0018928763|nr:NrdH-redoxin [Pseudactinotalea sp. HY158]
MARHGLPVRQVPLEQAGAEEIEAFKAAGLVSAPVVVTENGTWSGFRPDLIRTLAHNQHSEPRARATTQFASPGPGVPAPARAAGWGI